MRPMLTSPERRVSSRRSPQQAVKEPLQRRRERRGGERRDAPRARRMVSITDRGTGETVHVEAFLSLEGLSWSSPIRTVSNSVDVTLELPDLLAPLHLTAKVDRVPRKTAGRYRLHARFPELSLKNELGLARFLEHRARVQEALSELAPPARRR